MALAYLLIAAGICVAAVLCTCLARVKSHRVNALEMMVLAEAGVSHRDSPIRPESTFEYAIEYGRWHQRAIDLAAPYRDLFPVEAARVKANGGAVFPTLIDTVTVNPVHGKLRGVMTVRVVDLQALADRVSRISLWSACTTNPHARHAYVTVSTALGQPADEARLKAIPPFPPQALQ